jgi:uncharacterized membrane protein
MPTPGLVELVVIAVILAMFVVPTLLVITLLRRRPDPPVAPNRDPAMDRLRDRFASGDIDEAEYERLRSVLQRG